MCGMTWESVDLLVNKLNRHKLKTIFFFKPIFSFSFRRKSDNLFFITFYIWTVRTEIHRWLFLIYLIHSQFHVDKCDCCRCPTQPIGYLVEIFAHGIIFAFILLRHKIANRNGCEKWHQLSCDFGHSKQAIKLTWRSAFCEHKSIVIHVAVDFLSFSLS